MLLATTFLSACHKEKQDIPSYIFDDVEITLHNYYEVEDYAISWDKMFTIEKSEYYVYFYSTTCSHCTEIKDWIIEKALECKNIYFVKSSEKDVIWKDITPTIGVSSIEEMAILGYPTVIKICEGIVVSNCAGKTNIQNVLK